MNTLRVYWKAKFNAKVVVIDAATFDPAIHRIESDGPWTWPPLRPASPEPVKIAPPVIESKPEPIAMPRTPKATKKSK